MGILWEALGGIPGLGHTPKPWWLPPEWEDSSWPQSDDPGVLLDFVRVSITSLRRNTDPSWQVKVHDITRVRDAYLIVDHLVQNREWRNPPAAPDRTFTFPRDADAALVALENVARWLKDGPEGSLTNTMPDSQVVEGQLQQLTQAVGDEYATTILSIARNNTLSANSKMQQILQLDSRFAAKDSNDWSNLLGVSPSAIRQTDTWKRLHGVVGEDS